MVGKDQQKRQVSAQDRRRNRLAAQLRANIGKRKEQARTRAQGGDDDQADPSGGAEPKEK